MGQRILRNLAVGTNDLPGKVCTNEVKWLCLKQNNHMFNGNQQKPVLNEEILSNQNETSAASYGFSHIFLVSFDCWSHVADLAFEVYGGSCAMRCREGHRRVEKMKRQDCDAPPKTYQYDCKGTFMKI